MPSDWRYDRNVRRFRTVIQGIINDRRSGLSKSQSKGGDLLSILLTSEFYAESENTIIIDEIFTFFLAGMKTIQVSTTNLIYYLTCHPEFKNKLMAEILPVLEKAAATGDITQNLTYDSVMEFEYLLQCFNESLRIEPPTNVSISQFFEKDTTLNLGSGQLQVKKGTPIQILFEAIHHNAEQWPSPEKFVPARFDTKDPENKWQFTANGKPRKSYSFTPFMGGRRVCLGKTFAEVTIRFTVPLLFWHFDFAFVDHEKQASHKDPYSAGSKEEINIPMVLTNKVKA